MKVIKSIEAYEEYVNNPSCNPQIKETMEYFFKNYETDSEEDREEIFKDYLTFIFMKNDEVIPISYFEDRDCYIFDNDIDLNELNNCSEITEEHDGFDVYGVVVGDDGEGIVFFVEK